METRTIHCYGGREIVQKRVDVKAIISYDGGDFEIEAFRWVDVSNKVDEGLAFDILADALDYIALDDVSDYVAENPPERE